MWGVGIALAAKRKRAKELVVEVVGMPMGDAVQLIKAAYLDFTVLSVDGELCVSDGAFDPNRIGIVVVGGVVKGAQIG